MLALTLGLICFVVLSLVASERDRVGLGLLFSSRVDGVADARLAEPAFGIPPLYVLACAVAGAGTVLGLGNVPFAARWGAGVLVASFLLLTVWDMRRRRGTLAVYIRLRRDEIGFVVKGDVIEVPKLVFLVANQPTPIVWLLTALVLAALGVALFPFESWPGMLPFAALSFGLVWLWLRNRRSPWEPLARRLRWLSLRSGDRLTDSLQLALDLDPEVALLREAADAAVARFLAKGR
jgi:hypothetical protein